MIFISTQSYQRYIHIPIITGDLSKFKEFVGNSLCAVKNVDVEWLKLSWCVQIVCCSYHWCENMLNTYLSEKTNSLV